MEICELIWDEFNVDHIAHHSVQWYEVEEVIQGRVRMKKGRGERRYYIYGQTESGRYLTIIADDKGHGAFYVVTARDMTRQERRFYREKGKP